jgi:hypothetical protein
MAGSVNLTDSSIAGTGTTTTDTTVTDTSGGPAADATGGGAAKLKNTGGEPLVWALLGGLTAAGGLLLRRKVA